MTMLSRQPAKVQSDWSAELSIPQKAGDFHVSQQEGHPDANPTIQLNKYIYNFCFILCW